MRCAAETFKAARDDCCQLVFQTKHSITFVKRSGRDRNANALGPIGSGRCASEMN